MSTHSPNPLAPFISINHNNFFNSLVAITKYLSLLFYRSKIEECNKIMRDIFFCLGRQYNTLKAQKKECRKLARKRTDLFAYASVWSGNFLFIQRRFRQDELQYFVKPPCEKVICLRQICSSPVQMDIFLNMSSFKGREFSDFSLRNLINRPTGNKEKIAKVPLQRFVVIHCVDNSLRYYYSTRTYF